MTTFKRITAAETLALRQSVLWPDQPLSHVMVEGDDDALHIGAFQSGALFGVGSFFIDGPKARLRKLAIDPTRQNQGTGSALILHAAEILQMDGIDTLWCDARQSARGFYENLGFDISGDVFFKSDVAYITATKRLT